MEIKGDRPIGEILDDLLVASRYSIVVRALTRKQRSKKTGRNGVSQHNSSGRCLEFRANICPFLRT